MFFENANHWEKILFFLSKGLIKNTANLKCKSIMNKINHSVTIIRMAQRHLF
jgi:hypothetical protein